MFFRRLAGRMLAAGLLVLIPQGSVRLAVAGPVRGVRADHKEIRLVSRSFSPPEDRVTALRSLAAGVSPRGHAIVQFHALPDDAERAGLEKAGVRLLDPLPGRAFFASLPRGLRPSDPALSGVRWIGTVEPADRVSPDLLRAAPEAVHVLDVRPFDDEEPSLVAGRLRGQGFEVLGLGSGGRSIRLRARTDQLLRVGADDAVRWVGQAAPAFALHNDQSRVNAGVEDLQTSPYSLSGAGIDLGIWDGSAVEVHGDFGTRLTRRDGSSPNAFERNHATHVAGTMAGNGSLSASAGGSADQWKGMAPGADIISYDFNGDLIGELAEAIELPSDSIELSQNSWGYALGSGTCSFLGAYDSLCRDYDGVVAGSEGKKLLIVFSAGNDRGNGPCGDLQYGSLMPVGTAKNVLTVGGTRSDDDSMLTSSSWGPADDGRLKPDVTGPGCGLSAVDHVKSTWSGSGILYASICGTSMAAPAVSGAAALLWEQIRASYGPEPLPSTVKALLIHTARDLDDAANPALNAGPDFASGYGRIDARSAVDRVIGQAATEGAVKNGQTDLITVDITGGDAGVRVTLVWDDPGGAENAAAALVNDLDLIVTDPVGTRHFPWTLDPADPSADAVQTAEDHVNNVEQVWVPAPYATGTWSIEVAGTSVPSGPQRYSLVVTPDAGFEPFGPELPDDATEYEPNDPPETFTWHRGPMDTFRVEWSDTGGFTGRVKKSGKKFLSPTSFTPSADLWKKILKLGLASGTITWRVQGKDAFGNVEASTTRTIRLSAAEAASFLTPDDAESFSRSDPPPLFSWDDEGNSKFKITFSANSDLSKPKKKSGDSWLKTESWTPSAALWSKILALADKGDGTTVHYQIRSKDLLGRITTGPVRTLLVTP